MNECATSSIDPPSSVLHVGETDGCFFRMLLLEVHGFMVAPLSLTEFSEPTAPPETNKPAQFFMRRLVRVILGFLRKLE